MAKFGATSTRGLHEIAAAVRPVARLVDLVGALARPAAAGTSAVPGGVELVGNLRP